MEVLKEIDLVDWSQYETAYGNAAEQEAYCCVPRELKQLFTGDFQSSMEATHRLWCGLCHQHVYLSSAALPAYPFLLYGLEHLEDSLKVEILDILTGFAVCTSREDLGWQRTLRSHLIEDLPCFENLISHKNEDIAEFVQDIVAYLKNPGEEG